MYDIQSDRSNCPHDEQHRGHLERQHKVAVDDSAHEEAFLAAIDETIKYFNDGDIVEGTVVKVDRDEVLLDIGYKTEGVIPSRELSIKHDVDPAEVVSRSVTTSRPWSSPRRTRKAA